MPCHCLKRRTHPLEALKFSIPFESAMSSASSRSVNIHSNRSHFVEPRQEDVFKLDMLGCLGLLDVRIKALRVLQNNVSLPNNGAQCQALLLSCCTSFFLSTLFRIFSFCLKERAFLLHNISDSLVDLVGRGPFIVKSSHVCLCNRISTVSRWRQR